MAKAKAAVVQPIAQPTRVERALGALVAHRMSLWLWASVLLGVAIFYMARHMVGVMVFKLALMTMAGYLGYWISRALERGVRPHNLQTQADAARAAKNPGRAYELETLASKASDRRAWIVVGCLIASAMGG